MNEVQQFVGNFAENYESTKDINEFFALKFDLVSQQVDWAFRILKQLDPRKHSLCCLWILYAIIQKKNQKNLEFSQIQGHISNFLNHFIFLQINTAQNKLFQLTNLYSDYLISVDKAIFGVQPLMQSIFNSRDNTEQLSPIHREFAKLCLKSKCYQHALPIIQTPITNFKKSILPMDIASYLYYKGMLLTGLQNYQQAIESFLLVLSLPTQITHKVHTESYKKLLILSLITTSKPPVYPNYIQNLLKLRLESSFPTYQNLTNTYINKEEDLFITIVEQCKNEFEKDKNWGLILKLKKEYQKRRICELNNTYLTLRYNEILNSVTNLETNEKIEEVLLQMVNDGQIKAKIDSKQQMIAFTDSVQKGSTSDDISREGEYLEVIEELEQQNKRIIQLMAQMEKVDTGIKHSQEYIKKTIFDKGAGQDSSGDLQQQLA